MGRVDWEVGGQKQMVLAIATVDGRERGLDRVREARVLLPIDAEARRMPNSALKLTSPSLTLGASQLNARTLGSRGQKQKQRARWRKAFC
jgi:hypothetical protein